MDVFTKSTKYAIVALVELATRQGDRPLPIEELAGSCGVPQAFLAKLITQLVRQGILTSAKGKRGGVAFARPPAEISLADIVAAIEGPRFFEDCPFIPSSCSGRDDCPLASLWRPVRDRLNAFLRNTSLDQVARAKRSEK